MSFEKNTPALLDEVLSICGELTNGSSDFESMALGFLNDAYYSLLSGGNEWGVEVAEPWIWSEAKRPIVISLLPAQTGTLSLTNGSRAGTFGSAPTLSMAGRFLKVAGRADVYRIAAHTAASTSFSLDQEYLDDTVSGGSYTAYKLDYDLHDDTIIIDSSNNKIDFSEGSSTFAATITSGVYSPTTLATEIKTQMEAAGDQTYTISFNTLTRKFAIAHGGATLNLFFGTGTNVATSIAKTIGFDCENQTGAVTYTGAYSLSGILRLSKPFNMFKENNTYFQSARDSGKIFFLNQNTFEREYPLARMTQDVPSHFSVLSQSKEGLFKVRFNSSVVDDPIRVEVPYIPIKRKLTNVAASYPAVPGSFTKFLVYAASFLLLKEKSDDKAENYFQLAQAKLLSMVNDNRKSGQLAGKNFGKLIPRRGQNKMFGWTAGEN